MEYGRLKTLRFTCEVLRRTIPLSFEAGFLGTMNKLYTIPEYGRVKKISRQAVHDAIKHNRLVVVELPIFVEFEGKSIEIEKRNFIVEETKPK